MLNNNPLFEGQLASQIENSVNYQKIYCLLIDQLQILSKTTLPSNQDIICDIPLNQISTVQPIHNPEILSLLWHYNGRDILMTNGSQIQHRKGYDYAFIYRNIASQNSTINKVNTIHIHRRGQNLLLSGQKGGTLKLYKNGKNFQYLQGLQPHQQDIRCISTNFSSTQKVATCSDDSTCRIIDIQKLIIEKVLKGHCSQVKCIQWHKSLALLLSGSKDYNIKLWDVRGKQQPIATMYHHNNLIHDAKWLPNNPYLFISASKDATMKLVDIRNLAGTVEQFRAPTSSILQIQFHPLKQDLFIGLGQDGCLSFWQIGVGGGEQACIHKTPNGGASDDYSVGGFKDFKWHPLGYLGVGIGMDGQVWLWGNQRFTKCIKKHSEAICY